MLVGQGILYLFETRLLKTAKSDELLIRSLINSLIINSLFFIMKPEYAHYLLVKTREDYNLIADEFSTTRQNIWQETRFLFDDYLIPGDKVLDLGCGNARYYPLFKEKSVEYIGIDSSKDLIQISKDMYPDADFRVEDALNLSFPDNYFNDVYSIAVLHHLPSRELRLKFLNEAKRVLRPGGLLILTVWKFYQIKEWLFLLKYTLLKMIGKSKLDWKDILEPWGKKAERYYHWFSKKELEKLIKESGFEIEKSGIIKNKRGNRQNIFIVAKKLESQKPTPSAHAVSGAKNDFKNV